MQPTFFFSGQMKKQKNDRYVLLHDWQPLFLQMRLNLLLTKPDCAETLSLF